MEKLLISTKIGINSSSDVVGGSLFNILLADYFSKNFNYQVDLHDPFYNSKKILKDFCNIKDNLTIKQICEYDRIVDSLFYVSTAKNIDTGRLIKIEGKNKFSNFYSYQKEKIVLKNNRGLFSLNSVDNKILFKSFFVPYIYYYDLFVRENFITSIELKENITLPLIKEKKNVGLHIRPFNKSKTHCNFLTGEEYKLYIKNIIIKILDYYDNPNLILYGLDSKQDYENFIDAKFLNKSFVVEEFSKNPLESSIILSNYLDVLFMTINGFSTFFSCLGKLKNKLKEIYVINSEDNLEDIIHSRRILSEGILENNFGKNSSHWGSWVFVKKNEQISEKLNIKNPIEKINNFEKKLFIYDIEDFNHTYFDKVFENIIFKKLIDEIKFKFKNHKIHKISNSDLRNNINKDEFKNSLHLITHSILKDKVDDEQLGLGSFDFIKHRFLKIYQKQYNLNPSNLFYEDLYSYFMRCLIFKSQYDFQYFDFKKILIVLDHQALQEKNLFSKWKKFKEYALLENQCIIDFVHYDNNKIKYFQEEIRESEFSENFVKDEFLKYELIIANTDHFSLMLRLILFEKNMCLFSNKSGKYIFDKNHLLFETLNNIQYSDLFEISFFTIHELWTYLFKTYKSF